jgi:hypothetical protein
MLAAAVATEGHVVLCIGSLAVVQTSARGSTVAVDAFGLYAQCATYRIREMHCAAGRAHPLDESRSIFVHRHQRSSDGGQLSRAGVLEQRSDGIGSCVGGEAEPPVLVRSREVDQALPAPASAARTLDRSGERPPYVRRTRQAREQTRERLCLVRLDRYAPGTLERVPAASGYGAQELAQILVVGEAQNSLVAGQRGGEWG